MSMDDNEILDEPPSFDADNIIGKGKPYPPPNSRLEQGFLHYWKSCLTIPEDLDEDFLHLPSHHVSVKEFTAYPLPKTTTSLIVTKPSSSFHTVGPNDDGKQLPIHAIPDKKWLDAVYKASRQEVFAGKKSIEDPAYLGSRLPLWAIEFWKIALDMHAKQNLWKRALVWLEEVIKKSNGHAKQLALSARSLAEHLRWDEGSLIPGADPSTTTTAYFATFLSDNDMMRTDHINMMFAYLSDRAEEDDAVDSFVAIEQLRFAFEIRKWAQASTSHGFLRRLESRIERGDIRAIVFPTHMGRIDHWITFRIDFERNEIAYGDSLSHKWSSKPDDLVKMLRAWAKKQLKRELKDVGDGLEHGCQEDWTDCGVVAANTAAHEMFGDMLWSPERKRIERVGWFVELGKLHMRDINERQKESEHVPYHIHNTAEALYETPQKSDISSILNPETVSIPSIRNSNRDIANLLASTPSEPIPPTSSRLPTFFSASESSRPHPSYDAPDLPEAMDVDTSPSQAASLADETLSNPSEYAVEVDDDTRAVDGDDLTRSSRSHGGGPHKAQKRRASGSPEASKKVPHKVGKHSEFVPLRNPDVALPSQTKINAGGSRSSIWMRARKEAFESGNLKSSGGSDDQFRASLKQLDEHVQVVDAMTVRHFKCGKECRMRAPYDKRNFKTHVANCSGPPKSSKTPGGGMHPIQTYFNNPATSRQTKAAPTLPCPGVRVSESEDVAKYLERTATEGGGGPAVTVIAKEMFGKEFAKLSDKRKTLVRVAQRNEWKWRNDHQSDAVFATGCLKLSARLGKSDNVGACTACLDVVRSKAFKTLARKPAPLDENLKFLNKIYRNEKLGAIYAKSKGLKDDNPMVAYVRNLADGKVKGQDMFANLLHAVVIKSNKERRGVGMQGMTYAPDLLELAYIVQAHSNKAYTTLREFLPLPSVRTIQIHRAKQPQFPVGLSDRTFELSIDKLDQLQYRDGPVALSCDDTKLLASFRPYYDSSREGYYLMGHVGEPFLLADPEAFEKVVVENKLKKATKLRLWCLQIPIPKIPTIIVAALSIPDNLSASELFVYLWTIISGFLDRKVKIASYASDGSSVERAIQGQLEKRASRLHRIAISHGVQGQPDYVVKIPFFDGQPIAIMQDSKHLLKTFKNNYMSGARVLTFPAGIAAISHVIDMISNPTSPLFIRDVIKSDRQDDNSATRFFSAASLQWFTKNHPEHLGTIMYLFICGELIDAYQNRSISLIERVRMVMRAHFFFEMWQRFLEASNYPKSRHFVSPQCTDIVRTAIQGFLQALFIYRDHSGGSRRPFMPWLLGTEIIEHVFGVCRQIVKDFTMLDFHIMIPKLFNALRHAQLSSKVNDGKDRASGYSHTYGDTRGINYPLLSTYPTNPEINAASVEAFSETSSLFAAMGVPAGELYSLEQPSSLPGIRAWYRENDPEGAVGAETGSDTDTEASAESDDDYQALLDDLDEVEERLDFSVQAEQHIEDFRHATIAFSIEDRMKIASMQIPTAEELEQAYTDDLSTIGRVLASSLPAVQDSQPRSTHLGENLSDLELSGLVDLRFQHQTKQALTGVRSVGTAQEAPAAAKKLTERQRIIRRFSDIIREHSDRGITSGLGRSIRWTGTAAAVSTGNAANAAVVATAAAKRALTRRIAIFKKYKLPNEIGSARISSSRPLAIGETLSYGIVLSPTFNKVMVCKVLGLYSKSAGKNARHGDVSSVENVMAISNMNIQVYEQGVGSQFRTISHQQPFHVSRYDFIQPSAFLCSLADAPSTIPGGLKLSNFDLSLFHTLSAQLSTISEAVKSFKKKKGAVDVAEDDDE